MTEQVPETESDVDVLDGPDGGLSEEVAAPELDDDELTRVLERIRELKLDGLVVIGGDGVPCAGLDELWPDPAKSHDPLVTALIVGFYDLARAEPLIRVRQSGALRWAASAELSILPVTASQALQEALLAEAMALAKKIAERGPLDFLAYLVALDELATEYVFPTPSTVLALTVPDEVSSWWVEVKINGAVTPRAASCISARAVLGRCQPRGPAQRWISAVSQRRSA